MSFVQFEHCDICRISHKQGEKHVYSAKHRKLVKEALDKFRDKIKKAADVLSSKPQIVLVVPKNAEECRKSFWCTTCGKEFQRHILREEYFVEHLGLIEHSVSEGHVKNLKTFWFCHRLRKLIPDVTPYSIDADLHKRIADKVAEEEDAFKMNLMKNIRQEVEKVRRVEEARNKTLWQLKLQELRDKRNRHKDHIRELVSQKSTPEISLPSTSVPLEPVRIGPTKEDLLVHKFEEEERKRRGLADKVKIRTDLSSRLSTSLHNKVWLPYKVRRSLQRSHDVKGLANEVRGHYSRQAPPQDHKHPQEMREERHDATSDISGLNHSGAISFPVYQNGKVSIRPYMSKRKSVLNGSSYPSAFGQ